MAKDLAQALLDNLYLHASTSVNEICFMGYCVARGVKPLYIIGSLEFDSVEEMRASKDVILAYIKTHGCTFDGNNELASCIPIAHVIETKRRIDGKLQLLCAICSHQWVCDALEWLYNGDPPAHLRDAFIGLLCGYDSLSIEKFVENRVRNNDYFAKESVSEDKAEDDVIYMIEPNGRLKRMTDQHGQLFANPPDGQPVNNDINSLLKEGKDRVYGEKGRQFMNELPYGDSKDGQEK